MQSEKGFAERLEEPSAHHSRPVAPMPGVTPDGPEGAVVGRRDVA